MRFYFFHLLLVVLKSEEQKEHPTPGSPTYQLCDLGQVTLSNLNFLIYKMKRIIPILRGWLRRLNEIMHVKVLTLIAGS